MGQVWHEWGRVILASLVGLPLAAATAAVLARVRIARGTPSRWAWRASWAEVGAFAGTLPWVWMILTPKPAARGVNLVPLWELAGQLTGDPTTAVVQIGGNLLVFAAFGFFAPVRWRLSVPQVAGLAAAGSVVVEVLQYTLDLGRVSSVDDVLLNAAGAGLAAIAAKLSVARRHCPGRQCSPGQDLDADHEAHVPG
jgi:hypothetical protein